MTEASSDRSWVKAFGCFLVGVILVAIPLAARFGDLDPYNAGRALGRLVGAALVPAVIIGILSARSARPFGWLKFGSLYALFFVGFSLLEAVGNSDARREQLITDAEGAAPVVSGQKICHSSVPFQLLLSSSTFALLPELSRERPNLRMWVWEEDSTGERVLVQVMKLATTSPADFERFIRGVKSSAPGELLGESVDVASVPYSADLSFSFQNGARFDQRCLAQGASRRHSWIVCVGTVSADSSGLQEVRESLQLSSC